MKHSESTSPPPDAGLQAVVRRQTWAWLVAICRRMNLSAEIVDPRGALCSPVVAGPATPTVRRLLVDDESPLPQVVSASITEKRIGSLTVKRLDLVVCPIGSGTVLGALVLARDPFRSPAAEDELKNMAAAGLWLSNAVEAHLLSEGSAESAPFERLSAIHRVVYEASRRGTDRDVVLAFSETLAATDDMEVRGYVEDARGRFILSVESLSGSRSQASEVLQSALVPPDAVLRRLSPDATERMGFHREREVFMARLGANAAQPWVVAVCARTGSRDERLVSFYLDLLRQAMASAYMIGEANLVQSVSDGLLNAGDACDATGALEELAQAFDATGAALVVTASHGLQLFSAGDSDVFDAPRVPQALDRLVSTMKVGADTAVLAVRRPDGEPFTSQEQRLLDRAASLFAGWLPAAMQRTQSTRDRRATHREFEHVIEQTAARTLEDGIDVSALVINVTAAPLRPGVLHRWAADLRGCLRASDVAGTLSDREIGVLLPGTGPVGAVAVGTRIQARIEADGPEAQMAAVIGLASLAPGSVAGPIIQTARSDAARRADA